MRPLKPVKVETESGVFVLGKLIEEMALAEKMNGRRRVCIQPMLLHSQIRQELLAGINVQHRR